jgi:hypothetical protein
MQLRREIGEGQPIRTALFSDLGEPPRERQRTQIRELGVDQDRRS